MRHYTWSNLMVRSTNCTITPEVSSLCLFVCACVRACTLGGGGTLGFLKYICMYVYVYTLHVHERLIYYKVGIVC